MCFLYFLGDSRYTHCGDVELHYLTVNNQLFFFNRVIFSHHPKDGGH